jgi:hypothetical protein
MSEKDKSVEQPDLEVVEPGVEGSTRHRQQPIGRYQSEKRTWLSGDADDPLREEAAERARRAVEPGEPRE